MFEDDVEQVWLKQNETLDKRGEIAEGKNERLGARG
jgi:hypothetical protein